MKISAITTNIQHRNYKNSFKGMTTPIPLSKLERVALFPIMGLNTVEETIENDLGSKLWYQGQ